MWERIKDVCVKTILCGRDKIAAETARNVRTDNGCFKLFGFDIFLDADLKPWLLEVNNIPSIHINTIDAFVNRPMVAEMFNIVGRSHSPSDSRVCNETPTGLRIPRSVATKHEKAIRSALGVSTGRLWEERQDREEVMEVMAGSSLSSPLSSLTEADISALMTAEDELSQTREWSRIFPVASSVSPDYLQFWSPPSHLDSLLQAWEDKYGASPASRQQGRQLLSDSQSVSR